METNDTKAKPEPAAAESTLRAELYDRLVPHIRRVCRENGPEAKAKRRAQKALRLLDEDKGGTREYDSLFEQGAGKDDRTVAALWWLYRTNGRARQILWLEERHVPALVFEPFEEARRGGLFGTAAPGALPLEESDPDGTKGSG